MGAGEGHAKARQAAPRGARIPRLEWAAAAVGAVLLVGTLAFLVREALVSEERPGPVAFSVRQVRPLGPGFLVELEARNTGDATYAELEVEGTLRGRGGREERATVTFDYLPGRSSREGGLFFRSDPAQGELEVTAKGFRRP